MNDSYVTIMGVLNHWLRHPHTVSKTACSSNISVSNSYGPSGTICAFSFWAINFLIMRWELKQRCS
ncbi:unnamed protein product [Ectocarpus sp. CCAP 1310/34]|nr:unnamed protein product [Ectocarpus sp. CCAP 1310/34]